MTDIFLQTFGKNIFSKQFSILSFLNQFSRIRIILMIVLLNNVLTINYNLMFDFVYLVMWDNLMSELGYKRDLNATTYVWYFVVCAQVISQLGRFVVRAITHVHI